MKKKKIIYLNKKIKKIQSMNFFALKNLSCVCSVTLGPRKVCEEALSEDLKSININLLWCLVLATRWGIALIVVSTVETSHLGFPLPGGKLDWNFPAFSWISMLSLTFLQSGWLVQNLSLLFSPPFSLSLSLLSYRGRLHLSTFS